MSSRQALILAVPENSVDRSLNLPVVQTDADELARALRQSSYEVTIRGAHSPPDVSKNSIGTAIRTACRKVPEKGTLLIFFSGHGIHSGGHDYLLPWDADLQQAFDDTLYAVRNVSEWVDELKAQQIVLFVDACREGLVQGTKSGNVELKQWGTEKFRHVQNRQYSIVFSCKAGEYSHYVSGARGFSLFSRAVAQVLSIDHAAQTLQEVIDGAQALVGDLASQYDKPRQTIAHLVESNPLSNPGAGIICEGRPASLVGQDGGTWKDAVRYSSLWRYVDNEKRDRNKVDIYRSRTESFAAQAERRSQQAAQELGLDPGVT